MQQDTNAKAWQVENIDVEAVNARHKQKLFQASKKIFPKRIAGSFRSLKWWIMGMTLAIYYITPWLRWNRGTDAPDQMVLVDIANRRFFFGPVEIWPQEFYYVAGLLILAGVGLFLLTSTVGRAWCGYACPQTVWVDLFVAVERWIEGDRNARIKLDKSGWSFGKMHKRITVNVLWLLISLFTGGAWIFYFSDAPTLLDAFIHGDAPSAAYITVGILTAFTFIFGGYMREQVCTYMCPWPRIQGAMLDENSLTVTYNDWRGEPRREGKKKKAPMQNNPFLSSGVTEGVAQAAAAGNATQTGLEKTGDCVDCNLCVAVCPMGIDIREGQQLECITCALCIDACDSVMAKLDLPKGLISYTTFKDYNANMAGIETVTTWCSFIKPRNLLYTAIWIITGLFMLFALLSRDRIGLEVLHDRNPLYVQQSDGSIRNGYTIKILNMVVRPRTFELSLLGLPEARMWLAGTKQGTARTLTRAVASDQVGMLKVYVSAPRSALTAGRTPFRFLLREKNGTEATIYKAIIVAPVE